MHVEEIFVSDIPSDFAEEETCETRVRTADLVQSKRFPSCRFSFELFNQRWLSVTREQAFQNAHDYELDTRILDSTPRRSLKISWLYLWAFSVLAATAGLIRFTDVVAPSVMLPVILGASGSAALLLLLAAYRSHDRLIFYSQHGRVPLVILLNRNPDRSTFKTFVDALTRSIQNAQDDRVGGNDVLRHELKEHRRLMEQGIISEKRYARVKQRILDLHQ